MTHDTPHDTSEQLRWCENCRLNVVPSTSESGPECPSCGTDL
ncbi:hypothetical protein ACFQH2_10905 [Natronoarchaeum sp. GCM10025703]